MRQWTVGFSLAAGLIGFSATWIRFRQLDKQNASSLRLTSATGQPTTEYSIQDITSSLHSSNQRLKTTLDDLNQIRNNLNDLIKTLKENLNVINMNITKIYEGLSILLQLIVLLGNTMMSNIVLQS
ncbi:hypothetical protein MS3_00008440 [Schistosoma haematobium]|uniref:Transmembrane protein n=1 Tax=Schistosoma haematobium TaxID=6185 RepID=A0A922LFK1_SCHHA|nr:hypothetical protein MS3_00008440 [Schistosoma haematobium]KAH9581244.1 hypothetical protein MS3_00008440 [Schistosoma haematobium]